MSKVFLDSTALIDLAFRNREIQSRVRQLIASESSTVTSRYVIYEIGRGYLRNCIILYNASLRHESFSDLLAYVGRMRQRGHFVGTALGALEDFSRNIEGETPLTEIQRLQLFRAEMRKKIRRGSRQIESLCSEIVNPTRCRSSLPPPAFRNTGACERNLETRKCGDPANCGLPGYLDSYHTDFEGLLAELERVVNKDSETTQRILALRRLLDRKATAPFNGPDCYRCGDAIICHEVSEDWPVISKNAKHFELICRWLGLKLLAYS